MIANWSAQARSVGAWAVGGTLAVAGGFTAPVLAFFHVGNGTVGLVAACIAGSAGVGVGAYLAALARANTAAESRAPYLEAFAWTGAFLIASAFVFALPFSTREEFAKPGEVNNITLPLNRPWGSTSGHSPRFSLLQVHFLEAVPSFGALGGFMAAIAGSRPRTLRELSRSLLAAAMWAVAAILAAFVLIAGGYSLTMALGPIFLPLWAPAGFVFGALIAGGFAGYIAGAIGELSRPSARATVDVF